VPKFELLHPIGIVKVTRMPMFHNVPHVSRCIMQSALRRSVRSGYCVPCDGDRVRQALTPLSYFSLTGSIRCS
jgi:hypothetical protein